MYNSIQAMRGVAAFFVLLAHAKFVSDFSDIPLINSSFGAVGVDIFFVVSGFVIAHTCGKAPWDAISFMWARLGRVLPIYYIYSAPYVFKDIFSAPLGKILNTITLVPLTDKSEYTNPFHPYGWTLSFEMYFYCLVLLIGIFFKKKQPILFCWMALALIGVVGSVDSVGLLLPEFYKSPIILEFAFGVLLYEFKEYLGKIPAMFYLVGVAFFSALVFDRDKLGYHNLVINNYELGGERVAVYGIFALLLVAFYLRRELHSKFQPPKFLMVLGNMSYTLYLMQPFALSAGRITGEYLNNRWVGVMVYISGAIFASYFMWVYLEKNIANKIKKWKNG